MFFITYLPIYHLFHFGQNNILFIIKEQNIFYLHLFENNLMLTESQYGMAEIDFSKLSR